MSRKSRLELLDGQVRACPKCHDRRTTVAGDTQGPLMERFPVCGEQAIITD